jgi:hypothetical protein
MEQKNILFLKWEMVVLNPLFYDWCSSEISVAQFMTWLFHYAGTGDAQRMRLSSFAYVIDGHFRLCAKIWLENAWVPSFRREVELEALWQLILGYISYIFRVNANFAVCNVLTIISQLAISAFTIVLHIDMLGTLGQSREQTFRSFLIRWGNSSSRFRCSPL